MTDYADAEHEARLLPLPEAGWRLVTDTVMGGVSAGELQQRDCAGSTCWCLTGEVRTENNGGFIQMALDIEPRLAQQAAGFDGIRFDVQGNGEAYKLHLRTLDLALPWQSYRADFHAAPAWRGIQLPFARFAPYRTDTPLRVEHLRRIGVVAIGRAFRAELCVRDVALYRAAP